MGGLQHPGGVGRERIRGIAPLQQLHVRDGLCGFCNNRGIAGKSD
jgi:hypothetical protein